MSEEIDEVPGLVAGAAPRKRRMATRRKPEPEADPDTGTASNGTDDDVSDDESGVEAGKQSTMEDLDLRDMLPSQPMKPAENVKSLGDVIAKYNIGNSTEFKLQVWRTYPKIFPGGQKADGFYDTWDQPLTEELIQSEYGGGNFRIVVMGPHPTKPNTLKHYDSVSLNLAGTPKYDRQPKAVQQSQVGVSTDAALPSPMVMMGQENAKLSETAMKLAVDMASKEREERIRVEDKADTKALAALAANQPVIDAERRRADEMVRMTEERAKIEREHLNERLTEEREERRALERKMEELMAEVQGVRGSAVSDARELAKEMVAMSQRPQGEDGGKVAERMMESVLDKHRVEMESMRTQQQQMIDNLNKQQEAMVTSMRNSHQHEIATMREAAARELQSERDAGIRRQERADDQLKMEREERRRDQERQRELMETNDRTWKERIEMQLASTNQSWEGRHQSVVATYENRLLWQQQEIDRLKSDLADTKARMNDNSDPIAIVHKAKEIREAIGGPEASGGSGGSGGGIGMGSTEDWKNLAVEGLTERAPQLLQVLGGLLSGQQQQQQHQPGQIVQTPQGEMVVIQTPQGLALTPKAALDQAQAQAQGRMLPQQRQGQQQRRRVMPDAEEVANGGGGRKKRRGPIAATPNFADPSPYGADPLPVRGRRPPWEGGGSDDDEQPQQRQQQTPVAAAPRRSSKPEQSQQQPQQQRIARQMSPQERQGLSVIAKLVHEAVMNADEPEEFADKILKEWAPDMLKRVTATYSPDDIARGIMETQPSSAGATPAGQAFVRAAFAQIENALG
jgi:hypothetical protein